MEKYIKIENESALSKDLESGAIINTDKKAFESYITNRDKRILELKRLDNLESEISEIKKLLIELLAK